MQGATSTLQQSGEVTDVVLDNWNPDQVGLADLGVVAAAVAIALVVSWLIRRFARRAAGRAPRV